MRVLVLSPFAKWDIIILTSDRALPMLSYLCGWERGQKGPVEVCTYGVTVVAISSQTKSLLSGEPDIDLAS